MLTDVLQIVLVFIGLLLLVRKVAEMERYHYLRVVFLTAILSCIVIFLFVVYGFTFGHGIDEPSPCTVDHFCLTEM